MTKRKEGNMPKKMPVVVTTDKRGVFFGYLSGDNTKKTLTLDNPRMAIYWSADVKGVLGLAATGPTKGCRIGPEERVPRILVHGVTAVIECSPEATKAWEEAPWSS